MDPLLTDFEIAQLKKCALREKYQEKRKQHI